MAQCSQHDWVGYLEILGSPLIQKTVPALSAPIKANAEEGSQAESREQANRVVFEKLHLVIDFRTKVNQRSACPEVAPFNMNHCWFVAVRGISVCSLIVCFHLINACIAAWVALKSPAVTTGQGLALPLRTFAILTSRRICSITHPPTHTRIGMACNASVCSVCDSLPFIFSVPYICQLQVLADAPALLNAHSAHQDETIKWSTCIQGEAANKQTYMQIRHMQTDWADLEGRKGDNSQARGLPVIRLPFHPRHSFICVLNVSV